MEDILLQSFMRDYSHQALQKWLTGACYLIRYPDNGTLIDNFINYGYLESEEAEFCDLSKKDVIRCYQLTHEGSRKAKAILSIMML